MIKKRDISQTERIQKGKKIWKKLKEEYYLFNQQL